jgi:hypothetical protein
MIVDVDKEGRVVAAGAAEITPQTAVHSHMVSGASGARSVGPGCDIDASPDAAAVRHLVRDVLDAGPSDAAQWEPHYGRMAEAEARLRRMSGG